MTVGVVLAEALGAGDLAAGHHAGDRRRRDGLALLVDHEAAVGVAVEGQADVRAVLDDGGLQVAQVFRLQRVGRVVREGAVELEVQRDDLEGKLGQQGIAEHGRGGEAGHAVAGVDHDLQRAGAAQVHQAAQVLGVALEDVLDADQAAGGGGGDGAGVEVFLGAGLDFLEPGFGGDGLGAGLGHLDAVVLGRVVARGERGAGGVEGHRRRSRARRWRSGPAAGRWLRAWRHRWRRPC